MIRGRARRKVRLHSCESDGGEVELDDEEAEEAKDINNEEKEREREHGREMCRRQAVETKKTTVRHSRVVVLPQV